MHAPKLILALLTALLMLAALTGCGGATSTAASASTATPTPTATATSTPVPSPTHASTALIQTATATVGGAAKTILADAQGRTLYHFTADTEMASACTGGCASAWPPLLFTGSGNPTAATPLPHALTVRRTANGSQVEYDGHLLYAYSGDSAPGQTNGEGVAGKWFVATPNL